VKLDSAINESSELLAAQAEVERQRDRLKRFFLQAPAGICILDGPDFVFELVNPSYQQLFPNRDLLGKPLLEALPELKDQPIPYILRDVYTSGNTFEGKELLAPMARTEGGPIEDRYFNFIYQARQDEKGTIDGILVFVIEVTDGVMARQLLEQNNQQQQIVNEQLSASNEELAKSESRFRALVQQAPVAIFILTGRHMVIEAINDRMLKMLGKTADIVGKPYSEALPEFEGQPFFKLLDKVFVTGTSYVGNEVRADTNQNGELKEGYYNFIYQPIKDDQGITNSIICTAVDVTEQVNARKKVERAEESLRMAIDAAELGSYYINAADRIFVASPRLKEFFGFGPDEELPYEAAINQIHPDYRQAAADLVEAALTKGVRFDMEYPVIGYHDGKIRWVRGIGTVQHDSEGKNSYFTGVLHEITEKKQDEIRKNDFIGMVSHELKTPLTSLTAIVQLLSRQIGDSEDEFLTNALNIANVQVKKMNNMINGFLNVSRFESGKIHIHPQQFDLEKLIRDMINEIAFTIMSHTINFIECGPVTVNADRDKIGAVISNILSNAAKYSPRGKVIEVACKTDQTQALVSIKDEGIGINQRDIEKIFDRYYRVETNNTQHISGFGIGLYLSAEIIRRHDGKIWAVSENGQGSTFYFSLPLMPQ
jgi:two-component system sensor histidine kinase VicK